MSPGQLGLKATINVPSTRAHTSPKVPLLYYIAIFQNFPAYIIKSWEVLYKQNIIRENGVDSESSLYSCYVQLNLSEFACQQIIDAYHPTAKKDGAGH